MATSLTTFDSSLRPRLAAGVVVSLLVHGAVLAMVLTLPSQPPGELPHLLTPPSVDRAAPPPTPIGIDESRAVSINWLGFADPTEHQARAAEVEQAELSPLDAGVPEVSIPQPPAPEASAATPVEPAPETEVALEAAPKPSEAEPTPEPAPEPTPQPAPEPADAGAEAAAAPVPLAVIEQSSAAVADQFFRVVRQATARAREVAERAAEQAAEQAAVQAAEAAAQPQPTPPTPPAGDSPDANPSPKQADATSLEEIAEWIPGRPAAAQGLDITTVRPRWNITTRLSAVPRNPMMRIDFRKNGTVAKAEFLPGLDTGYADVDGPLLNAIYDWTAKGKALDELPAGDPKAVVSIKMQMILVPSKGTIRRSKP